MNPKEVFGCENLRLDAEHCVSVSFDNNSLPVHVWGNIPDEEMGHIIVKTKKVKK